MTVQSDLHSFERIVLTIAKAIFSLLLLNWLTLGSYFMVYAYIGVGIFIWYLSHVIFLNVKSVDCRAKSNYIFSHSLRMLKSTCGVSKMCIHYTLQGLAVKFVKNFIGIFKQITLHKMLAFPIPLLSPILDVFNSALCR